MPRIRVMIVDDHEVVRTGLKAILEIEEDLEVVGEAGSANEAIQKVPLLNPNVILMDVRMGEMNGIQACRLIKSAHNEVDVLMLTSFSEEEAVMASILAGASGYLLKNVGRADLLRSIRAVAKGESLLDPTLTSRVLARLKDQAAAKQQDREKATLSEREREVVNLMTQGLTNKQIADKLVVNEDTGHNYVSRILDKLGLTRRN